MFEVVYQYQRVPPMPPGRLAAPLVSMVFTEPPPPEPSMMRMMGRRKSCAISSAISGLAEIEASADPSNRADLVKAVGIDHAVDPLADGEPALVALPLDLVNASHLARERFAPSEVVEFRLPVHSSPPYR